MAYSLAPFRSLGLDEALLRRLLADHDARLVGLRRLWAYYRNPAIGQITASAGGRTRLAQEQGLPARLTGVRSRLDDDRAGQREVVIENDIAWRIHAMVDFMFGRPVSVVSNARDERKRREIEQLLDAALEAAGGAALLQDAALLGAVYGWVDFLVRPARLFDGATGAEGAGAQEGGFERALALAHAGACRVEVVEPQRALPLHSPADYRALDAYIIRFTRQENATAPGAGAARAPMFPLRRWLGASDPSLGRADGSGAAPARVTREIVEVISRSHAQVYENGRLTHEAPNRLGVIPVAHVQNTSQPFAFEGLSEVEALIPLQDELNTRLSDRANRVTLQTFRMYLAKGVDGFLDAPVGPGRVWMTDNPEASVEAFGGDAASPSEDRHIEELREALDKASGVTPVVGGVLTKIGNLSSENALRVTLTGMLTKTARKRAAYSRGIAEVCGLILRAFDAAGLYATAEADRTVRVVWPDPLPRDERERLESARMKRDLGVPPERVLAELGYAPGDHTLT